MTAERDPAVRRLAAAAGARRRGGARRASWSTRSAPGWPAPPDVVHDLGSGTGSMGRWLAARLPGPQHWVLHDRDADLLARAAAGMTGVTAADGAPVTVETRLRRHHPADRRRPGRASLVTASALLDMLTAEEVERMVAACAGRPGAVRLTVTGRVRVHPGRPAGRRARRRVQRPPAAYRRRPGPARAGRGGRHRGRVRAGAASRCVRPSPWRLGPEQAELAAEWFAGWLGAAGEERPDWPGRPRRTPAAAGRGGGRPARRWCSTTPTCSPADEPYTALLVRDTVGTQGRTVCHTRAAGARPRPIRCWAWATAGRRGWRSARRPAVAGGHRPVPGRGAADRRPALAAALGIGVLTTVCCAWRWSLVAGGLGVRLPLARRGGRTATGRSSSTPRCPAGCSATCTGRSGTAGTPVTSAAASGRWCGSAPPGRWCRWSSRWCVLLAFPSPVRPYLPVVAAVLLAVGLVAVLLARALPRAGARGWARALRPPWPTSGRGAGAGAPGSACWSPPPWWSPVTWPRSWWRPAPPARTRRCPDWCR